MKLRPLSALLFLAAGFQAPVGASDSTRPPETELAEIERALAALPSPEASEQNHGRIGLYGVPREPTHLVVDLGRVATPEEIVLFPARLPTGAAGGDGSNGFPPALEVAISEEAEFVTAVRLATWSEESPGAGNRLPFLRLSGNGASGRFVRVSVSGSRPRETGRGGFFTLGEIVVLEQGRNAALGRPVAVAASAGTASIENAPRWQAANLTDGYLWCLPFAGRAESSGNGYHSAIESTLAHLPKWVEVDLGGEYAIDELHLVPAHPRDFADTAGFGFPPAFRVIGEDADGAERVVFETQAPSFPNPGNATVVVPGDGGATRRLRIETGGLWHRTGDYIFALAELRVWSGGENVALGKAVSAADFTETGSWSRERLTDGFSSRHELLSWTEWLDALSERRHLEERAALLAVRIEAERERATRRWLLFAGATVVLVALVAGAVLLGQRRRAAKAESELKRRLAADLHDELGASLSHLALQSDLARARVASDDPVASRLETLSENARETLDHLRDMVWLLAPVAGSWAELESRLEGIAERLLEGVAHRFERSGERPGGSPPLGTAREIVLFLKEALTNVRKHAGAASVGVTLAWLPDSLRLEIADDGVGFDPDGGSGAGGRGLGNLESRAKAMNGLCRIDAAPGQGTSIILTLPTHAP